MQLRFNGPFHQSDIKNYLSCPRSFYYNRVLKMDREKTSWANLGGRAGHSAIEYAHKNREWDPDKIFGEFQRALNKEQVSAENRGLEIVGNMDQEKYRQMLTGYAAKPWNREAEVLALEAEFYFEITPAKTTYAFAGRVDQLVEIRTDLLRRDFPRQFENIEKETVILHRDTKFGQKRQCSPFELALDVQFDIYGYAFLNGVFPHLDNASMGILPDYHVKYHLQDHIPYADDKGTYLKDENGGFVPCDIVPLPCLVGKKQEPCKGKRKWCRKQRRGPGMYFTARPAARLEEIPKELMETCSAVRMNKFPRKLNDLCFNYCQFRSVCEGEIIQAMEELEAA